MPKNPTKKTSSYSEKLKDPRWQKKRLEILERDNWICRMCGESENTLHVHHLSYKNNTDPWDYPPNLLITLCEKCHKHEHDTKDGSFNDVKHSIEEAKAKGYLVSDIEYLVNTITDKFESRNDFIAFMFSMSNSKKQRQRI